MNESWTPTKEAVDYLGKPIESDRDFFVSAPQEIGRVVAAHSSLRKGRMPASGVYRVGFALFKVFLFFLGLLLPLLFPEWLPWINIPALALIFNMVWLPTPQTHEVCSFVGTEGVAIATCWGSRTRSRVRVFRFGPTPIVKCESWQRCTRRGLFAWTEFYCSWNGPDASNYSGRFDSQSERGYDYYLLGKFVEALVSV